MRIPITFKRSETVADVDDIYWGDDRLGYIAPTKDGYYRWYVCWNGSHDTIYGRDNAVRQVVRRALRSGDYY